MARVDRRTEQLTEVIRLGLLDEWLAGAEFEDLLIRAEVASADAV